MKRYLVLFNKKYDCKSITSVLEVMGNVWASADVMMHITKISISINFINFLINSQLIETHP